MNIVLIVQARMGSTRLPGKVMLPLHGEPMLARLLERLHRCQNVDAIVVATTDLDSDTPIAALAAGIPGTGIFRGSEQDVLSRYLGAARKYQADVVIRVTSDCPLIDPELIDRAVKLYGQNADNVAYVSNAMMRTYPRGLDFEIFPVSALEAAAAEATLAADREHVTRFIWRQPERFPQLDVVDVEDNSHLRWTVDTPEDYRLASEIYDRLYGSNPLFGYPDVLELVNKEPELQEINRHVEQKPI